MARSTLLVFIITACFTALSQSQHFWHGWLFEALLIVAESEQTAAQGAKERQVQAEEEARLALLTSQAGMKLTLTDKVQFMCLPSGL